jgi:hypothetical protein
MNTTNTYQSIAWMPVHFATRPPNELPLQEDHDECGAATVEMVVQASPLDCFPSSSLPSAAALFSPPKLSDAG